MQIDVEYSAYYYKERIGQACMGKILDFIERDGEGKYSCYKTRKLVLDENDQDTLDYDDKPAVEQHSGTFAETDLTRVDVVAIDERMMKLARIPLFSYFLDGSRHVYKVDDIAIGNRIFPFMAGQIIVGCCERKDRDTFKKYMLHRRVVLSLPRNFNYDDDKEENFCRNYCEKINAEIASNRYIHEHNIKIDKILLYPTDGNSAAISDKNGFKNSATAKIQSEMSDEEQFMVKSLCENNLLDNEHFLIKDGSIEYNPSFSNMSPLEWNQLRSNYKHVVGVSKMFNPDLMKDYKGRKLSKTIASLRPFERTKVYRYPAQNGQSEFAMWYLRLRKGEFRETHFSDVIKCEMFLEEKGSSIDTNLINLISANLIKEAYPTCYGKDTRWANHLYPVFLTESFCKSNYINQNIILNLF